MLTTQVRGQVAAASAVCLTLFLSQGFFFIHANAPTYDEAMHLAAGYSYLATGDFRLELQNPPLIKAFLAIPLYLVYQLPFPTDSRPWRDAADFVVGQEFVFGSVLAADHMILLARLPNLFLGAVLLMLIGWWAYRLWGWRAAIVGMALACLEPNLVAHSSLVTTDMGASLLIFSTVYLLWEYYHCRAASFLVGAGISCGIALVCKFSTILLIPIIGSIVMLSSLSDSMQQFAVSGRKTGIFTRYLLQGSMRVLVVLAAAALVIPAGYFFQGFEPWVTGFGRFLTLAQEGQPAFFLGQIYYEGSWAYYAVAFLIKTPIGSLLLITSALISFRAGSALTRRELIFLGLPVLIVLLSTTQAKVNIGLRHILPVYPFLFVLAARLATVSFRPRWVGHTLIAAPLLFTAYAALRIAPHQLAYFNEFAGGPGQGYRYLSDSNLDWGQDLKTLKAYMENEQLPIIYLSYFGTAPPAYYGIRYQYVPGTWPLEWPPPNDRVPESAARKILAISVYNLQDVSNAYAPLFQWLWRREPLAKLGYSIFVYDLTEDREGLERLAETYSKVGIPRPGERASTAGAEQATSAANSFLISPNKRHR